MRIGLSTLMIQRGKTGVAQYVFALVRAFLPHTAEHSFTLFVLEEDLPLFQFASARMELVAVPERWRSAVRNIAWHQAVLPGYARRKQLDVLHVPSYRRLLLKKPCALVATIHDLAPFHVPGKYDWKRMFYGRVVVKRLARRQDRIIAISHNTARDIAGFFGLGPERVTIIHNGLEHDRFSLDNAELAKASIAQRFELTRPFFLYVARLEHPGKNHVKLIAAFERFKAATQSDWQLVLGGSDWHGADVIHRSIKQSRFATDIRAIGFVDNQILPDLYRAAAAFAYPSLYEGFGLPPLEAMACGCPVLCSTRGSLGEVIGEAALVVDPDDVDSIANQLSVLATDNAARARLRAAGLAQAQKFDWTKTAAETLKVYRSTASRTI